MSIKKIYDKNSAGKTYVIASVVCPHPIKGWNSSVCLDCDEWVQNQANIERARKQARKNELQAKKEGNLFYEAPYWY